MPLYKVAYEGVMKVIIRVDSSIELGSGHLMRCLTLAGQLSSVGAIVKFVCKNLPGAMFTTIELNGYQYKKIAGDELNQSQQFDAEQTIKVISELFPEGFDWLVVDHYSLDALWESQLRQHVKKIMVIDDLANRRHDCDLLLDQNYYRNYETRYSGLVSSECLTFLGPSFVLFRPEFYVVKEINRVRDGSIRRILVFFGASDATNQTHKVIESIPLLKRPDIDFDIVVGASNPNKKSIEQLCEELPNVTFYCQVTNMAEMMLNADLAIGAGGAAMWERCFLGLPAITVVFASNQEQTTKDVVALGAIDYLGWSGNLTTINYANAINRMLDSPEDVRKMSGNAMSIQATSAISLADKMKQLIENSTSIC